MSLVSMMAWITVMFMMALMTVISVEPFFIGLCDFDSQDGFDVIRTKFRIKKFQGTRFLSYKVPNGKIHKS
jgi:hypothetical protein